MLNIVGRLLAHRRQSPSGPGDFIAFIADLSKTSRVRLEDDHYSPLASARLRLLVPARELARRIPVWLVPFSQFIEQPRLESLGRPLAVIIGKLSTADVIARKRELSLLIATLRNGRTPGRLFADLSDDYAALGDMMRAPFLKEYQRGLGRHCEFIVPSSALAAAVRPDALRGLHVIEDPFETPAAKPVRTWRAGPVRLAWFGTLGVLNLPLIERELSELLAAFPETAISVELVSEQKARDAVLAMEGRLVRAYPRFSASFATWSLSTTDAALERSDFVWLPQEHRLAWGRVKSHNRLVSAIRAGRLALASPIPSYEELASYAWVGEPLAEGLRWALAHPREAVQRVWEGQRYVEQRFSPAAIGHRWAEVLDLPAFAPAGSAATPPP